MRRSTSSSTVGTPLAFLTLEIACGEWPVIPEVSLVSKFLEIREDPKYEHPHCKRGVR